MFEFKPYECDAFCSEIKISKYLFKRVEAGLYRLWKNFIFSIMRQVVICCVLAIQDVRLIVRMMINILFTDPITRLVYS